VEMESGVHVEVIDGRTEADLICNTFWTQDLIKDRNYLYIDVGGGSTELTWLEKGKRVKSASFPIGTVRMLAGTVGGQVWPDIETFLTELHRQHGDLVAIGTGGNINRLFKEAKKSYGEPLSAAEIGEQRDRIAEYSFEDRVRVLRLRPDRADVVLPAADIFLRIMGYANITEIFVPKVGLADGIIYDMYMRQYGHAKYPLRESSLA
jgi:exopolyphosphatase / guanosine-5'-triphosphate,3'-diphosphate pyrophosphatase